MMLCGVRLLYLRESVQVYADSYRHGKLQGRKDKDLAADIPIRSLTEKGIVG
jgi:hypothetical protein